MKSILFVERKSQMCPRCMGSGRFAEERCNLCGGTGELPPVVAVEITEKGETKKLKLESTNTIDALQEVRNYLLTEEAAEWNKQTLLGGFANPSSEPAFYRKGGN